MNKMKQRIGIAVLFFAMLGVMTSCVQNESKQDKKANEQKVVDGKKDCKSVTWSHQQGENGPENWANLCDGFSDCGGKAQSPINIEKAKALVGKKLLPIKFDYGQSKVSIVNNSHTVQFNIDNPDNKVNIEGKEYQLLQFHYHALSEHTIDGKHYPLEVHFVHKHSDSDFAVLGVMFEEGNENKLLKKYLNHIPTKKGKYKSDDLIDLLALFPKNKDYYHYDGSLTTPPCSEVVNWYVLATPVQASKEQLKAFSKILHDNYRPVMPLNNRTVELYKK